MSLRKTTVENLNQPHRLRYQQELSATELIEQIHNQAKFFYE